MELCCAPPVLTSTSCRSSSKSNCNSQQAWHILEHHRISESPVFTFVKVRQWPKVLDTYSSGELSISLCQLLDLWKKEAKWVKTFSASFTSISNVFFYAPEMPVVFWRFLLQRKFGEAVVGGKLRDANSDCGVVRVGNLDLSTWTQVISYKRCIRGVWEVCRVVAGTLVAGQDVQIEALSSALKQFWKYEQGSF